jgi:acyl carrier protein
MDKNEIYIAIKGLLVNKFDINGDLISPEKLLDDDLAFDSLDAVDLLIYLNDYVNGKPDPALFKNAMTVQDLVNIVQPIWKGKQA